MIYYLNGILAYTDLSTAVIDVGGVGYKCTVSGYTLGHITDKKDSNVKLYTYMSVREDNVELFGFCNEEELSAFKLLTSVSGVGPKAAMAILTQLSPEKLSAAIASENAKLISAAQGVGAKTAARVVLELKDKIGKTIPAGIESSDDIQSKNTASDGKKFGEALDALLVLGYNRSAAVTALKGIDTENNELEKIIRMALAKLMK